MSFCIRHVDNIENKVCSVEWSLNEPLPIIDVSKVVEIQADGEEMELVFDIFNGLISRQHRKFATWEGSLARLIIDRLQQLKR